MSALGLLQSSIERLKVSRHLAEEAMNYFEECVSISTMDSTDFSSPEDPQPNSVVNVPPKSNSRFFHKGRSIFQKPHTPADQHGHHEVSELIFLCLEFCSSSLLIEVLLICSGLMFMYSSMTLYRDSEVFLGYVVHPYFLI